MNPKRCECRCCEVARAMRMLGMDARRCTQAVIEIWMRDGKEQHAVDAICFLNLLIEEVDRQDRKESTG